ncbi:hypothetical protein JKP88DRAFT_282524 [Tribonema minus]|uniref:Uncharacterized protein n=1 Tax=Tribonema minus TaxID=303371 RepID=A0A836C8B2_9STRA|nr:hypothetical protein JKP88DRAFT_282524 [Tribonema minus]
MHVIAAAVRPNSLSAAVVAEALAVLHSLDICGSGGGVGGGSVGGGSSGGGGGGGGIVGGVGERSSRACGVRHSIESSILRLNCPHTLWCPYYFLFRGRIR